MSAVRIVCDRCHVVTNTDAAFRITSAAGAGTSEVQWPIEIDVCGPCHDRLTDLLLTLTSEPEAWVQIPERGPR